MSAGDLGGGRCYVSIHPASSWRTLVYRDYGFYDNGLLMVFSSYGEGDSPALTSAREFWLFPRVRRPEARVDSSAAAVSVLMTDGSRFETDVRTAELASVDRGEVRVSPRIDPAERGGVEFPRWAGLLLDGGFRRGESPTARPKAESTFRDADGRLCAVRNDEVFAYAGGEHSFKFDDAALSAFLKVRCPGLRVGF